ncbi:hypothetical protein BU23DRAFT_100141 [Bimuria novae-zelandiae CBS 107.79]|uniref:Uncharacterized protein n=1 Tax=Bimuria novae-zelandiae CBS 107.79 TaxID=1447943 RepID=A0A6A5VQC9_9PLEO|nr:hypothetical protein BU23DRAFT_100141 [Bimuria novae-zelandiae CBS 107.79]
MPTAAQRLRLGHVWGRQTRIGILARILWEVFTEHVLEPLMVARPGAARLGAGAAHRRSARHGRSAVVSRIAHSIILTPGARQPRRQLGDVLVGVVEEAAPDASGHVRTIGTHRGPGRRRRRRGGGGRVARDGRDAAARRLDHAQLLPVVREGPVAVGRPQAVPRRRLARFVVGVFGRRSRRDRPRRDLRLLFYAASLLADSTTRRSGCETREARRAQVPVSPHASHPLAPPLTAAVGCWIGSGRGGL